MAAVAPARAEDIKRLQTQVDQMKERLDFISPMLPLVNFVQDFFQKVECEASVQLMRLKKAQVVQSRPEGDEDGVSNAQLETVKFLHYVTDAVIAAHISAALQQTGDDAAAALDAEPGKVTPPQDSRLLGALGGDVGGSGGPGGGQGYPRRNSSSRQPPAALDELAPQLPLGAKGADSERTAGYLLRPPTSPQSGLAPARFLPIDQSSQAGAPGMREASRGSLKLLTEARGAAGAADDALTEPQLAEPGTGGTVEDFRSDGQPVAATILQSKGPDGLVLGKGSWAAAYRQAQGPRLEALRLLCTSGIVTARELSDDLTVISEDHMNECVLIASEMLQTWPLDAWARQPHEAKKFFEARLTALYQRKFGEQKA